VLCKKLDVRKRCARFRESGGSFDKVRTGFRNEFAHLDFFVVGEKAGFDDDFEDFVTARFFERSYLVFHIIVVARFKLAYVDDHIDFVRAVCDCVLRFELLDGGRIVSVGETDDGADLQISLDILRRPLDIGRRDTHRGAAKLHGLVTEGLDLVPCGLGLEQGMVHVAENGCSLHNQLLLCLIS